MGEQKKKHTDSTIDRVFWALYVGIFGVCPAMIYWASNVFDVKLPFQRGEFDLEMFRSIESSKTVLKLSSSNYRPLLYRKDIRLLVLHPAKFEDDIHIHIEHTSVGKCDIKFEALSYAWGPPEPTRIIYESGRPVAIRENLYVALQHLRNTSSSRVLWVDNICIDQSDMDERSQQIRLMGDVFSTAVRVIVWLGEESGDVKGALNILDKTWCDFSIDKYYKDLADSAVLSDPKSSASFQCLSVEQPPQHWHRNSTQRASHRSKRSREPLLRRLVNGFPLHELNWYPVRKLLHRAWFHRLWVYQEVVNAKEVVVVCGDIEYPWYRLAYILSIFSKHDFGANFLDPVSASACDHVLAIEEARSLRIRRSLFEAILSGSYGACSDPRDKIFAVMSIADGKDVYDWEVSFDYSLSICDLFRRFAIWDIVRCDTLRSLSCASPPLPDGIGHMSLPSWVPEWSQAKYSNILIREPNTTGFRAAGYTMKDVWFTHDMTMLHVTGTTVDTVEVVGSAPTFFKTSSLFEVDQSTVQRLSLMRDWFTECWTIASSDQAMTFERYDALWKTMLCSLTADRHPFPRAYSKHFLSYLQFLREAPEMFERYLEHPFPRLIIDKPRHLDDCEPLLEHPKVPDSEDCLDEPDPESTSCEFHDWFNQHYKTNMRIEDALQKWSLHRRICRTAKGRLAMVPDHAAPGDVICILHGADVPFLLRLQEDGTYIVVGECYVHGIMRGEASIVLYYKPEVFRIR